MRVIAAMGITLIAIGAITALVIAVDEARLYWQRTKEGRKNGRAKF